MASPDRPVPLLRLSKEGISAVITYGTNPIGAELRCRGRRRVHLVADVSHG